MELDNLCWAAQGRAMRWEYGLPVSWFPDSVESQWLPNLTVAVTGLTGIDFMFGPLDQPSLIYAVSFIMM